MGLIHAIRRLGIHPCLGYREQSGKQLKKRDKLLIDRKYFRQTLSWLLVDFEIALNQDVRIKLFGIGSLNLFDECLFTAHRIDQ